MTFEKSTLTEISRYISSVLADHFGDSPQSTEIIYKKPFIVVHLKGFLMPSERIFTKRGETKRILETRDLLMNSLKPEMIRGLRNITGYAVSELYADWNLEMENGLLITVLDEEYKMDNSDWPQEVDAGILRKNIMEISKKTQKEPEQTNLFWLAEYVLLIERVDIMVDIEKELIQNGVIEELKLAKRPLEQRLFGNPHLETILSQTIREIYVDWNFTDNKAYTVLIMEH